MMQVVHRLCGILWEGRGRGGKGVGRCTYDADRLCLLIYGMLGCNIKSLSAELLGGVGKAVVVGVSFSVDRPGVLSQQRRHGCGVHEEGWRWGNVAA